MITRDFVMRQIEQIVQALGVVLGLKRDGLFVQAEVRLHEALALATDGADLVGLDREATLALAHAEGAFAPMKAVALADLLRESSREDAPQQARWLYEAAMEAGEAVPFDVAARIASLPSS